MKPDKPATTIVHGPKACGKTRNAAALARHFRAARICDDWLPGDPLPKGALALTEYEVPPRPGVQVVAFDRAIAMASTKVHH